MSYSKYIAEPLQHVFTAFSQHMPMNTQWMHKHWLFHMYSQHIPVYLQWRFDKEADILVQARLACSLQSAPAERLGVRQTPWTHTSRCQPNNTSCQRQVT